MWLFRLGKYDDGIPGNSTFAEGDWNGDGVFDSSDLVLVFQLGTYEGGPLVVTDRRAAAVDAVFGAVAGSVH
jgi:hypothetical protein